MKEQLKSYVEQKGHPVKDVGCHTADRCDYPDIAGEVLFHVSHANTQSTMRYFQWSVSSPRCVLLECAMQR